MSRNFKFVFFVIAVFTINLSAQVYKDVKPDLKVACSESPISAGETAVFNAALKPESKSAAYNWTVSNGIINSGQGTSSIEVQTFPDFEGNLTAMVEISGIYFERIGDSCTIFVNPLPKARLLAEFPHSTQGYIKMMLDGTIFLELQNDPTAQGYILIFPKTPKEKVQIERIIRNQIKVRKFDASRITITEGTKNSRSILQFWTIPAGAKPPTAELKKEND